MMPYLNFKLKNRKIARERKAIEGTYTTYEYSVKGADYDFFCPGETKFYPNRLLKKVRKAQRGLGVNSTQGNADMASQRGILEHG